MNYVSLHTHSCFSLRDGYATLKENIARAKELGMTALACTEHGTTTGLIEFYRECKKEGIKPILGVEAYFCEEHYVRGRDLTCHLVLLAKNNTGYHNILKMMSIASTDDYFFFKPRIDMDLLKQYHEGIICMTACRGGVFKLENYREIVKDLWSLFGDDFYIEIQSAKEDEQTEFNHRLVNFAEEAGIPLVVTCDSHYANWEDAHYHRLWCNARDGYYVTDDYYIQSHGDLVENLHWHRIDDDIIYEAIENTNIIADKCNVDPFPESLHNYPVYPSDDPKEDILKICRENWKEKTKHVSKEDYPVYGDRVKREIEVLEKVDYFNYLLLVRDVLNFCKDNDILTGYSRGSVAGSLVCYLMDITKIDPIPYNLVFERFCHTERISPADIDTDVESGRRDDVVNYLKEKYGEVLPCRTVQYLDDKGAVKQAGNRLGISPATVNTISTSITSIDEIPIKFPKENYEELIDLAKHFKGRISAYSQHACAVMVFQKPTHMFTAVERQKDNLITAYEFPILEDMGLLKLDILAIQNLDIVHQTLNQLESPPDIYNLPLDDEEVFDMLGEGGTSFCFQIEGAGMTDFCKKLKPKNLINLAAVLALFRPGALNSGIATQYIARKNGQEYVPIHDIVEETLKDTYGCMFYQEDMIRLVRAMTGMTMGEADMFRRAVGKKKADLLASLIPDFIAKCEANNIPKKAAEEVANNILACADYAFSLNHAQGYAFLTYLTAYMKKHYPLEYICSCLNANIDDTDKLEKYLKECKKLGIEISLPNIRENNMLFQIKDGRILYGLKAIKHVGKVSLNNTNAEHFKDFVVSNIRLNKRIIEMLIKSGACDEFGDRKSLMEEFLHIKTYFPKMEEAMEKIEYYSITENQRMKTLWENKLSNYLSLTPKGIDFDIAEGEVEAFGFVMTKIPSVKTGTIKDIYTKNDKKGREMAWVTFMTKYGKVKVTVFATQWKSLKKKLIPNTEWIFCDKDGVLKEIRSSCNS